MPHFFRHFAPIFLSSLSRSRTRPTASSAFVPVRAVRNVGNGKCKATEWSGGPSYYEESRGGGGLGLDEYVELGEWKGGRVKVQGKGGVSALESFYEDG